MAITLNIKELEKLLEATPASHNVMLKGKHGIGKSEILTRFFIRQGMKVISLFLGQMSDPGDLIGLPRLNPETGTTDFMPPYWFPVNGEPIVLFLDELNRARPEVLQTIMDLALNRKLAGRTLPEGSRIISAVNDGEEYQLTELDPALVSRFNIYNFRPEPSAWLVWARQAGLDDRVINFISGHPAYLDEELPYLDAGLEKSADRRGWKRVSDVIKDSPQLTTFHKKLIGGIIGAKSAGRFFDFAASTRAITGKDLMLEYDKYINAVKALPLHAISLLNDSIFGFIEAEGLKPEIRATVARSLEAYVDMLLTSGRSEAFAHWISDYSSSDYPETALFVLTDIPDLYRKIQEFINSL